MVLKTAYSLLVVFLWSVTATTAKDCGQIIQVVVSPIVSKKGENVTLTCVTNCTLTNATYIWYRNGQRLDEPTSRQLSVISYYTSSFSCSVKDHEDLQSPTMCVLGRKCFNVTYTRQSICALEGSVMDLPCKYQYPNHHTLSWTSWYVQERGDERPVILSSLPEYSGRVKYLGDNMSECTLRITDLRETDSAEYKFRFKTQNAEWGYSFPGTTLTVTDLQVKVTPGKPKTKTLTCSTSCNLTDNSNLTYVWYKNGQRLDELVSHQHSVKEYHTDSFSCSLLNLRSAVVCVVGQSCMNVSYTHQSVCALKGSTVNISCTFSHLNSKNVTEKTWFNKWDSGIIKDLNQDPEYAGRVEYHRTTDKDSTLTVTDLRESDSAEYKFRFTSNKVTWGYSFPGTTLTVTGNHSPLVVSERCRGGGGSNTVDTRQLDVRFFRQFLLFTKQNLELKYISIQITPHCPLHSAHCFLSAGSLLSTYLHLCQIGCRPVVWPIRPHCAQLRQRPGVGCVWCLPVVEPAPGNVPAVDHYPPLLAPGGTTPYLQVKVTPATKEGNVTLTCSTSCPLTDDTTYIWHQNGQRVTNEHNNVLHLGLTTEEVGYSCAVKGHEDLRSETITVRDEAVFPWVPVVTVGAVLTVAVLLVTIYCTMRRRSTGGSDATTDPQSVHPDAMGETQTAQNLTTLSPDYDTLGSVHPDTNSDTYSVLNMKTRSPDYDTLDCVRDSHNDNDGQKNLDYENFGEPPQNLD
ncbi:uncharacterized protein LOC117594877 isoform X3 [Esox lucius]|uniref:uncharacterized protein LOC117594877 isoform X3 n=1 Tax=Esox lucius TaxID=8010 RepID=UPI001477122B|nr:uncharacterized protein LOC117594877 isoform X3 [Esox lucius]